MKIILSLVRFLGLTDAIGIPSFLPRGGTDLSLSGQINYMRCYLKNDSTRSPIIFTMSITLSVNDVVSTGFSSSMISILSAL